MRGDYITKIKVLISPLQIKFQTQKTAAKVTTSSPMEIAEDDASQNAAGKYPSASRGGGRGRGNTHRGRGKFHNGRGQSRGRPGVSKIEC